MGREGASEAAGGTRRVHLRVFGGFVGVSFVLACGSPRSMTPQSDLPSGRFQDSPARPATSSPDFSAQRPAAPPPPSRLTPEGVRVVVRDGGAIVLRVPTLVGEGAMCHSVVVSPFTTAGEGRLAPALPDDGRVRAAGFLRGAPPPPPPPPPDPYRRLELELRVGEARLALKDPRVLVPATDAALLAACETSIGLGDLPAYASVEACEADAAPPLSWGECHEHLAAMAADLVSDDARVDARIERLERIFSRGGKVWALELEEGRATCMPWRFTPDRGGGYGEMVRSVTRGARTTRTEYAYEHDGSTLLVLGPSTTVFENGEEVSSMGAGCGDRLFVRHPDDRRATVAGTPWFFRRADCLAARDSAPRRGGC
jgi:hypothetical protein